ncbi:hypothetical protein [Micromonospora okii]|uniref:hypothetical protein n=1 Tax=Micromonospora okii TaxID=1182970 RepID=UPI001E4D23D6|nr:hypothetical protein [Micromonospora okii]
MNRNIRVTAVLVGAVASAAVAPSPASAATGSWTVSQSKYNIYLDGGYATMYFSKSPQSAVPSNALITGTSVLVTPYPNGRTSETVRVCYRQQYSTTEILCTEPQEITGATTITLSQFNGQSARGSVTVRHTLYGGTYPATGGTAQDTVTVSYQY